MTIQPGPYAAWSALTIGVANLAEVLELWCEQFGFNVASLQEGDDPQLAKLLDLQANDIQRQALVRTNNSVTGMLHFVQFNQPHAAVRDGAENFDLVPKNLDIYVKDLPAKVDALKAAGYCFRTEDYSSFTARDGMQFREIQMPAHDMTNIVLVEVVGHEYDFSSKGFAGIGPFVLIVPDVVEESNFLTTSLKIEILKENLFKGPEIERIVGLPPDTALKIFILGHEEARLGQLELVEYQGVRGNDLYPRAKPKSLGVLHMSYVVQNAEGLRTHLANANIEMQEHGRIKSLLANGSVFSFRSPAGFRMEVYETSK